MNDKFKEEPNSIRILKRAFAKNYNSKRAAMSHHVTEAQPAFHGIERTGSFFVH